MAQRVLLLGFYNRFNCGDDAFASIFNNFFLGNFPQARIDIVCIDDAKTLSVVNYDLILVGAGDVVNNYFLSKLQALNIRKLNPKAPIYAIGVGIGYEADIAKLGIFDFIIHRNFIDIATVHREYPAISHYQPDVAYLLPKYVPQRKTQFFSPKSKHIGFFLSRNMFRSEVPEDYKRVVVNLITFVEMIASMTTSHFFCADTPTYQVHLFSMNSGFNQDENDNVLNTEIYNHMIAKKLTNVHQITCLNLAEINSVFSSLHMVVATRYHAHIFALMNNVPLLSIYSTRKVQSVLLENDISEYSYKLPCNEFDSPIGADTTRLWHLFNKIETNHTGYVAKLQSKSTARMLQVANLDKMLYNAMYYKLRKCDTTIIANLSTEVATMLADIYRRVIKYMGKPAAAFLLKDILTVPGWIRNHLNNVKKDAMVEAIMYKLVGNCKTPYNWGLADAVVKPDCVLHEHIEWVVNDMFWGNIVSPNKELLLNTNPINNRYLNLDYFMNSDLRGVHRSGWQFVMDSLRTRQSMDPNAIVVDGFVDKTFGWNREFYVRLNMVPIKRPWLGFVHHTFDTSFSKNNITSWINDPDFLASLPQCVGLVVLSQHLQQQLITRLMAMPNVHVPPVYFVKHPTEDPVMKFSYAKFKANRDHSVLQIGGWLRDTYAIYRLPCKMPRKILNGKHMERYYLSTTQVKRLEEELIHESDDVNGHECTSTDVVASDSHNKFVEGIVHDIDTLYKSVKFVEYQSNTAYDELLSCNVVFIRLIDASAVNTIIECIMRNTPIAINPLPAVVEYLGPNYPMYYSSLEEAARKIDSKKVIKATTQYLAVMNKEELSIDHFLRMVDCIAK